MTVRLATLGDADRIFEMATHFAALPPFDAVPLDVEWLSVWVRTCLENLTVFVAVEPAAPPARDLVVGFIALQLYQFPWNGQLTVDEVAWWVEPDYRKTRAGFSLLVAAEKWATTNRAVRFKMSAPSGSDVGTFLERRGFAALDTAYVKSL